MTSDRPAFQASPPLPGGPPEEPDLDLWELVVRLWSQRVLISTVTLAATLLMVGLYFVVPRAYNADATILPVQGDSQRTLAAGLSAQMGSFGGLIGGLASGRSGELVDILSSRAMVDRVIDKLKLDKKLTWTTRNGLRSKVIKMRKVVGPVGKTKVISIVVEAPSRELASDMANAFVSELKILLDEMGYNQATRNRRFIEGQLKRARSDLKVAEDALVDFQARNRIASLPETVMASIRAVSDLEAERISAAVQLQSTEVALGTIRSKVNSLQLDPNAIAEMEVKRRSLAAQEGALGKAKEAFLDQLTKLPPKAIAFARLQRDVQVQNAVYLALNQELQSAIISENRESDAFLPLDPASPPDFQSRPRLRTFGPAGLMAGLLLGVLVALIRTRKPRPGSAR